MYAALQKAVFSDINNVYENGGHRMHFMVERFAFAKDRD
jgi:hypothetical protein